MKCLLPYITVCLIALTLTSCKKDKPEPVDFKAEGYIKEAQTGKPLDGYRVSLYKRGESSGIYMAYDLADRTITDSAGYYVLEGTVEYDETVLIMAKLPNDYMSFPDLYHRVKSNHLWHNINLEIPGYVRMNLKNLNPSDSVTLVCWAGDAQSVSRQWLIGGIDKVFKVAAKPNTKVYYNVIKKGLVTKYMDSVNVPLRDTVLYSGTF